MGLGNTIKAHPARPGPITIKLPPTNISVYIYIVEVFGEQFQAVVFCTPNSCYFFLAHLIVILFSFTGKIIRVYIFVFETPISLINLFVGYNALEKLMGLLDGFGK